MYSYSLESYVIPLNGPHTMFWADNCLCKIVLASPLLTPFLTAPLFTLL